MPWSGDVVLRSCSFNGLSSSFPTFQHHYINRNRRRNDFVCRLSSAAVLHTSEIMNYKPLDASVVGIDADIEDVRRNVWEPLLNCVLNETCLTPPKAAKTHQVSRFDFACSAQEYHNVY